MLRACFLLLVLGYIAIFRTEALLYNHIKNLHTRFAGDTFSQAATMLDSSSLESSSRVRIACIGSSSTAGNQGIGQGEPYPSVLEKKLGDGYSVTNLGRNASMVEREEDHASGGPSYWQTSEFEELMKSKWNIIVLIFGASLGSEAKSQASNGVIPTNDTVFFRDFTALIKTVRTLGSPDIFIAVPPPKAMDFWENRVAFLQKMIPMIAAANNIEADHVLDMHKELAGDSLYSDDMPESGKCTANTQNVEACKLLCDESFCDNQHPNALGNKKMAAVVARAIRAAESS